jgi:hypothetical protein
MRAAMALLMVMVTIGGCTIRHDLAGDAWVKPDATIQQVTLDEMACVRDARDAGQTPDLVVGGVLDVGRYVAEERQRAAAYRDCMDAKGYAPTYP